MSRLFVLLALALPAFAFGQNVQVKSGNKSVEVKNSKGSVEVKTGDGRTVRVEGADQAAGDAEGGVATAQSEDGAVWKVEGAGGQHTHTCVKDQDVRVEGAGNNVTLHGPCRAVRVEGSGNQVQTDLAAAITVEGMNNGVKWKAALKGKSPKVSRAGLGNSVEQVK